MKCESRRSSSILLLYLLQLDIIWLLIIHTRAYAASSIVGRGTLKITSAYKTAFTLLLFVAMFYQVASCVFRLYKTERLPVVPPISSTCSSFLCCWLAATYLINDGINKVREFTHSSFNAHVVETSYKYHAKYIVRSNKGRSRFCSKWSGTSRQYQMIYHDHGDGAINS